MHIGTYSFVQSGVDNISTATHTWTHTNKITSNVSVANEPGSDGAISIYPNPFSSETTMQSGRNFNNATLTVYNTYGQQAKEIKNISGQSITLHRDELPGGLYFIRLTQGDKLIATKKLLIAD